jgi:repressor LexA
LGISRKRERILKFIREFIGEKGYAPTVRDIVRGCAISTSSVVQYHLDALEKEGHIRRDPRVFRSIRLNESADGRPVTRVPLLGTIAAGTPLPVPGAETWHTDALAQVPVPEEISRGCRDIFALRVKGTSMIDALIDDGDIVLMQQAAHADDGDMVAVWLKNQQETTLKRIFREGDTIKLEPANRQMSPIYENPDNVTVQGRVVGVIRHID